MSSLSPVFPASTLDHLSAAEVEVAPELTALRALLAAGWRWRGLALGAALEESFYRLNNLPRQIAAVYAGLDPADPDEDIVEEAEEEALALVAQHYLLDETIDAFYDGLASLPASVVLRRPGAAAGRRADHRRAALLELKHLFQDDWRVEAVMDRLALTASLAIDARTVLVGPADDRPDAATSERVSALLGYAVEAWVDEAGALTRALLT